MKLISVCFAKTITLVVVITILMGLFVSTVSAANPSALLQEKLTTEGKTLLANEV